MAKYYPINLNVEGKRCVVVGGGAVSERKVKQLLYCGARVKVVSPEITLGLRTLARKHKIVFKNKKVSLRDLSNAYLVISAAGDRETNLLVSSYCRKKHILVNVVDAPQECDFILPSVVRQGELTISISTGGISPALSKKIRQDLEKKFGREYARFLQIMKKLRPEVIRKIENLKLRKAFFEKAVKSTAIGLLKRNREKKARQKLKDILNG